MIRQEKGSSLINLTVSLAIAVLIAAGAGITAVQILKGTERNENHARETQQTHNLGRWFSRDALMAENITAGDNPETPDDELLSMYWREWTSGDTYNVRYIWLDDFDSLKKVMRNQVTHDKEGTVTENKTSLIAHSISTANLSQQANTWVLNNEINQPNHCMHEYRAAKRTNL